MNRHIKKVAILGSGVMGSRIACHFANVGCEVLLLDILPKEPNEAEKAKGLTLESKAVRNRIVNEALQFALASNPSPIYKKSFASRIQTGNFEDDMAKIADVDWIIEVVIERLDIKQQVFATVEKFRKPGTLISTNTSGIPIHLMLDGRSDDFKKHFAGTHFFNPPRYLPLLEVIPTKETSPEIIDFYMTFGSKILGKKTVLCKDTPGFIGNRIGVYSMAKVMELAQDLGLSIEEADSLTGAILERPKTGTFKLGDLVGLDTAYNVTKGLQANLPNDQMVKDLKESKVLNFLIENKFLGDKTKKGFYYKEKDASGNVNRFALDLETLKYRPLEKAKFPVLEMAKQAPDLKTRLGMLLSDKSKAGDLLRKHYASLFAYISQRVPEISDVLFSIDDAIRSGYAWTYGPFENWDMIGVQKGIELAESEGFVVAEWVKELVATGNKSFYKSEGGKKYYYDIVSKTYQIIPGTEHLVILDALRETNKIWGNSDATLVDLGDGILNLEFHTKMNTIGGGVIEGINKSIDLAEKEYKGLVISNTGGNFSAGANVGMIFMMAAEQDYDELNFAVKAFQDTMMRVRYSNIPVIVAPHNMALGGGCELSMHSDKVVAHAELYMGLVEFGVGLIPGGGGSKEFAKRFSEELKDGDIKINRLRERFLSIGQAKVSTSAYEAFDLGYLRPGTDEVVVSREYQLTRAKAATLELADKGYIAPKREKNITVLGQEGLGIIYVGANSMKSGHYMSEHDQVISEKLGWVLCGGDLSENTVVSEQYLLDLERKAFVELCQQRKTLERLESLVKSGKILRN
ncbi:3-hydroxyacyl-CoA dehydrogenase/enoyl-CoA hydratase family protein [Fluviicola taffensis]|uniref:3-hydroxyacyl-CoA dehydrogenase NAD-binding protein n=1 Tax=Fluviicola taffensis (strain DSM 16823 / NCIMB 13979 / RW262) TaxID=755732 RepID=F2ID39_FLUTR|nr:3-hydroxyacyl-CoA dehydrogenase/enoyl-CoA hydratase family protein [Fluviicola taffensis]AEA44433.1 3-hydroxyacyl-CoA dehydrogenase NAD-binding protein [Fluviicola taffensis DSM 16823]